MDNKHNSLNLALKICSVICLGHYLFFEAHSFPRASLSENCSLLGTDNVRGQISTHIFASNEGYCLYMHFPGKSYSKMYGTEPRYNDLRYNDIPNITMS